VKPAKSLPPNYSLAGSIDLEQRKTAIGLNLVGLALLFVFGWIFLRIAEAIRPEFSSSSLLEIAAQSELWLILLGLAAALLLHELVHGFFFWLFTGERPKLGIHALYAFAAAPDWYLPRGRFIVTAAAPFVLITTAGLLLLTVVSTSLVAVLLLALIANAAGSVGDLVVIGWLLLQPSTAMIRDSGPKITLYKLAPDYAVLLRPRWLELMRTLGVDERTAFEAFGELAALYSGAGRYYHTLRHVEAILGYIDDLRPLAEDFTKIELAAWFHDVIYDPRANDNEARSADYASQTLHRLGLSKEVQERVAKLILATTTHEPVENDMDAQVLLDADLAPLSADVAVYDRDAWAIRKEFAWIPEAEFRANRASNLAKFLDRPRLFQTDLFFKKLEDRARSNITREIAILKGERVSG
jgi:predicted metal-dependent HD superfamily phosphohydrolase